MSERIPTNKEIITKAVIRMVVLVLAYAAIMLWVETCANEGTVEPDGNGCYTATYNNNRLTGQDETITNTFCK